MEHVVAHLGGGLVVIVVVVCSLQVGSGCAGEAPHTTPGSGPPPASAMKKASASGHGRVWRPRPIRTERMPVSILC